MTGPSAYLPEARPAAFHTLAKPTGAQCNLDCAYCFYLSKEALYPNSHFRMTDDVQDAFIRQQIEGQRLPQATIAWQGGEPTLMGVDFYRRAIGAERKYARPGMVIENTIQTNGTLLDAEWCEFLREERFLVGLSIDGPREVHDRYRLDRGGHPTFDKVFAAARLLQEHGVDFNALTAVTSANGDSPLEVYRFLRDDLGVDFIQFIPVVERALAGAAGQQLESLVTDRSVGAAQWGSFLIAVFDDWLARDVGKVFVQIFEAALASWSGIAPSMCIFRETCGDAVALEHTGDVYSCDHFVEPSFRLGNIREVPLVDLVASPKQRAFGAAKRDSLPRMCRECDVRFACHGECPKNRFIRTPDGEPGLNYLCAGYLAFFRHIDGPMMGMADLLRQGRYADEIMSAQAASAHRAED